MLRLVQTCEAAPEQYDLMAGDKQIGYLRLRHGYFAAYAYGPDGPEVYSAHTIGDGSFDPSERKQHLDAAVGAIAAHNYAIEYGGSR